MKTAGFLLGILIYLLPFILIPLGCGAIYWPAGLISLGLLIYFDLTFVRRRDK